MAERTRIRLAAHAKTNLLLRVREPGPDGFHALETLFVRMALADEVELRLGAEGVELEVAQYPEGSAGDEGPAAVVPTGPDNLCWRAAERFHAAAGPARGVAIALRKRIPAGAGLGGGSADAAAVLRGLNELHGRPLGPGELLRLAGELGSDVPFALLDEPAAVAWGRGVRLLPVPAPPPRPALVAVPERPIATADAYRWLDEDRASGASGRPGGEANALPAANQLADWAVLRELAANDFETTVFGRIPALRDLRDELAADAEGPVLLSGSGSALVAVHDDESRRDAAADRLAGRGLRTIRTRLPV